jgi:hypothetical protein
MPLLDAGLFSSVSCRGCQQEPPPMTSRYDLALEPFRTRLRSATPHLFALEPASLPFARRSLRCDGGVSDPNARSRRRPTERAGRHLEPRTAKRLLQLHTTHARVHERAIFALAVGCAHRASFPAPRACARLCEEANHVSPTGSKTGHPFLANGPRRSTRVEEPSRRLRVTLPKSRFLGAVSAQRSRRSEFCVRSGVSQSLPLSLSEHPVVVSAVSDAELECPSEFRESQAVARICVHVFHRTNHLPDPFEPREA